MAPATNYVQHFKGHYHNEGSNSSKCRLNTRKWFALASDYLRVISQVQGYDIRPAVALYSQIRNLEDERQDTAVDHVCDIVRKNFPHYPLTKKREVIETFSEASATTTAFIKDRFLGLLLNQLGAVPKDQRLSLGSTILKHYTLPRNIHPHTTFSAFLASKSLATQESAIDTLLSNAEVLEDTLDSDHVA